MSEVLDDGFTAEVEGKKTKRAFRYFLANLLCLILLLGMTFRFGGRLQEGLVENIFIFFVLVYFALSILGFRNSVLSIFKKEKWNIKKAIAVFGNFVFFGILLSLLIFNIMDLVRFYQSS